MNYFFCDFDFYRFSISIDWFPISIFIDQLRLDLIKQRKVQFLVEFVFINKIIILSFKVWSGF